MPSFTFTGKCIVHAQTKTSLLEIDVAQESHCHHATRRSRSGSRGAVHVTQTSSHAFLESHALQVNHHDTTLSPASAHLAQIPRGSYLPSWRGGAEIIPPSSVVAAESRHFSWSSGCNSRARWLRRSCTASTLLCGFPSRTAATSLHAARISSATSSPSSATGG